MQQEWRYTVDRAQRIKLLSEIDVLESLSLEEIESLSQSIAGRHFQTGEVVYAPGDTAEVLFLLLDGRIRLYGMAAARELTFDVLQDGAIFGVASLTGGTQDEYAQVLEPSRVELLNLKVFWQLVRENPEVNARVMGVLGGRLRSNRSRMMDIALKEVPARLASLILDLCQSEGVVTREGHYRILNRYTQEQVAAMIGAKREAVTRAFGELQERGRVQLLRRQIHITDLSALNQLAAGV
jgi:CRP-like cAMP-binding protein